MKFQTIVADPPWRQERGSEYQWRGSKSRARLALPYPTMSLAEITALDVRSLAADDAHLFIWTTQRYLEATPGIVRAWGFEPSCTLVWCKAPHGWGPGGVFQATVEFVVYGRRGRPEPRKHAVERQWWEWPRPEAAGHSAKPEALMDMVEAKFPGPYLEMFARRARLNWETWGNESLGTVELGASA